MKQLLLLLALMIAAFPCSTSAEDRLAPLEGTVLTAEQLQPGLRSYRAVVHTVRIAATIAAMTAAAPPDVPRPEAPVVAKYWRREPRRTLIVAEGPQASPFMQQMVQRVSANLAIEPEELLLPAGREAERRRLTEAAVVRSTETALADSVLRRLELSFAAPADIGSAFYGSGLRLPQKGIVKLQFDIDVKSRTVRELAVQTEQGEVLLAEFRYRPVNGGMIPERVRVTSPDGKIDDLLEITFAETGGFLLPVKTVRVLNRPDLKDRLEVSFSNYSVNQPFPAEIEAQLTAPATPAGRTP